MSTMNDDGKVISCNGCWCAVIAERNWQYVPANSTSWDDCQKFLKELNAIPEVKASGRAYRFPTADEWEYACRTGSTGDYCKLADGTEIAEEPLNKVRYMALRHLGKGGEIEIDKEGSSFKLTASFNTPFGEASALANAPKSILVPDNIRDAPLHSPTMWSVLLSKVISRL